MQNIYKQAVEQAATLLKMRLALALLALGIIGVGLYFAAAPVKTNDKKQVKPLWDWELISIVVFLGLSAVYSLYAAGSSIQGMTAPSYAVVGDFMVTKNVTVKNNKINKINVKANGKK